MIKFRTESGDAALAPASAYEPGSRNSEA